MIGEIDETVLNGLQHLQIDDTCVNKMRRRKSVRIQERNERRWTLDMNFSFEINNNLPAIESPVKEPAQTEFELELTNIHYQKAMQLFTYIKDNEYLVRRRKKTINDDDATSCGCKRSLSQIENGERGCGKSCLNHAMCIECDSSCLLGKFCGNQRFQRYENARCTIFITEQKGYGLFASTDIPINTFIMEFVGEVVSMNEFRKRSKEYAKQKLRHHYVMTSSGSNLIDATKKGNLTRFVNHSCDPNAETQKWTANGKGRIGIFARKPIKAFEEITINYQFERFG